METPIGSLYSNVLFSAKNKYNVTEIMNSLVDRDNDNVIQNGGFLIKYI